MKKTTYLIAWAMCCLLSCSRQDDDLPDACSDSANIADVSARLLEDNALRVWVSATTDQPAKLRVAYWLDEAGSPTARTPFGQPAQQHGFGLIGLKPDAAYLYRLEVELDGGVCESPEVGSFHTDPLPGDIPAFGPATNNFGQEGGYFLINQVDFSISDPNLANLLLPYLLILDRDGDVVWYQKFGPGRPHAYQWTHNNTILAVLTGTRIVEIDLLGNELYSAAINDLGTGFIHHEVFLAPDGKIGLLTANRRTVDQTPIGGEPDATVVGETIVMIDKAVGKVWEWTTFDVWDPLDHPGIVDIFYEIWFGPGAEDWLHGNAFSMDLDGNYLLSLAFGNIVCKVNAQTGQLMWTLGDYGDVAAPPDMKFYFQHNIHALPNGNYLLFDNGTEADRPQSRALEFKVDEGSLTAQPVWEYRLPPQYFSDVAGSAQKLENGNCIVTSGTKNTIIEVDVEGNTLWQVSGPPANTIYRSCYRESLY